jgi:HK97 family phage portal protein
MGMKIISGGQIKNVSPNGLATDIFGVTGTDSIGELYKTVPFLNAAITLTSNAVGSLPLRVTQNGEAVEGSTIVPFIQSFGDLLNAVTGDLLLYGAAYIWLGRNKKGAATEARRLYPLTITPVFDHTKGLVGFKRNIGQATLELAVTDVVWIWEPNRTAETGPGVSRANVALAAAGMLKNADTAVSNLYANGAILPTVAIMPDPMPPAELDRVQDSFKRMFTGVKNAFSFRVLTRKTEFQTIGEYPDRLALPELTLAKREDIATALGVPHSMLFSNAANYATSRQDAYQFYDTTVIPVAKRILSALNTQLFNAYGIVVDSAEEQLETYQQLNSENVASLSTMFGQGVITVNEFRSRTGFTPVAETSDPAPDNATEDVPLPDEGLTDAQKAELRAYTRYTTRRLKEGKAARPFKTEHLPPALTAAIEGQLDGATVEGAKAVFDSVWAEYP